MLVLEGNYIVRRTATESAVELRETTCNNTIDQPRCFNCPAPTLLERSHRETATYCAHVTYHQENILLLGNQRESFANRITLAQAEQVVIKEKDSDHISTVSALLELRQDHACEFVTARHIGGKHIGNFHDLLLPSSGMNYLLSALEIDKANTPHQHIGQRLPLPHTFGGFVDEIAIEARRLNSRPAGQGNALMRSLSCGSFDRYSQRLCDATYPFIVEASEER